ncbi:hypothetical protein Trydic_g11726 [Trypoxylus dichotomus]
MYKQVIQHLQFVRIFSGLAVHETHTLRIDTHTCIERGGTQDTGDRTDDDRDSDSADRRLGLLEPPHSIYGPAGQVYMANATDNNALNYECCAPEGAEELPYH